MRATFCLTFQVVSPPSLAWIEPAVVSIDLDQTIRSLSCRSPRSPKPALPEAFVPGHPWQGLSHSVRRRVSSPTGVTRCGRELLAVPALRKDSRRISLEFIIVLLHHDTGELIGTAALIRDVTT